MEFWSVHSCVGLRCCVIDGFDLAKLSRSAGSCGADACGVLTRRGALVVEDDMAGAVVDRDGDCGRDFGEMGR